MQRHFLHCPSAITAVLVIAASGMAGCLAQPRMAPYPFAESPTDCRSAAAPDSARIQWVSPADSSARDKQKLDEWCRTIGPVLVAPAPSGTQSRGSLVFTIASWNMNVGAGRLVEFVEHLRRGEFTVPDPVGDFVILLQEAYRVGAEVPRPATSGFRIPKRLGSADPAADIRHLAALLGLHLVYAPAMRNGRTGDNEGDGDRGYGNSGDSDRGNAILSTLPLDQVMVIELPFERQRRIAVVATAHGATANGEPRQLRLVSTHFETRAGLTRGGPAAARRRQARALIDALAHTTTPLIVGGDFNSSSGNDEPAVHELRAAFPASSPTSWVTWRGPLGMSARLDHIFARVAGDPLVVRRVRDRFGSDHHPLITTMRWKEGNLCSAITQSGLESCATTITEPSRLIARASRTEVLRYECPPNP